MDSAAWDARYAASERVWSVEPNQFVAAHLASLAPGRALDLAAGEGRNAVWLSTLEWDVTAVDYSAVAIERGRASGADVTWVVGDVLTCALPADQDLVLVSYLQLPATQMRQVWPRAFAALRPGGTLFVIGHDSSNLTEGVGGPQDPDCLYVADDVLDALHTDDLLIEEAGRVPRVTEAGTAYDVLVKVRRS